MKSSKVNMILVLFGLVAILASSVQADGLFDRLIGRYIDGSGDLITEQREVKPFSEIKLSGPFDLLVTCGKKQEISITIDDNLMDIITTEVHGGVLKIKCEENFSSHRKSKIEISLPSLEALSLSGSGDAFVRDAKADDIEFDISGSGTIEVVDLEADMVGVTISGSGEFSAIGKTKEVEVRVSGSGDVDLGDLIAEDATVRVSGSGDVEVFADENFSGRVSGSGDIRLRGNPKNYREKISGSGNIREI